MWKVTRGTRGTWGSSELPSAVGIVFCLLEDSRMGTLTAPKCCLLLGVFPNEAIEILLTLFPKEVMYATRWQTPLWPTIMMAC